VRGNLLTVHIGLVGAGRIGAFHARTLAALPAVDQVTVADLDPERGDVATAEELVVAGVDALVIATPTALHGALLRLAASAGLPAFCEKPVALELELLDEVIADVERAGTLVPGGFQRRFDEGYRAARDAVRSGAAGTLLVLRAATHDPFPPSEHYIAGSGGIFRDLHIHDFDAIRFVTGEEVVEVYADGAVRETAWFADHGDVDAAVAVLRLAGGALAVVTGTRRDPLGYDVRLEVFGTCDSLAVGVDAMTPLHPPGSPRPRGYRDFLDRFESAYRAELAAFVEAVQSGGPSPCPLGEARAALAIAVAADRSRAEGRPVGSGAAHVGR
jgi:myo-inositol 2-dehydrogenase/D-chiro-inositol 1-dehydrogenase